MVSYSPETMKYFPISSTIYILIFSGRWIKSITVGSSPSWGCCYHSAGRKGKGLMVKIPCWSQRGRSIQTLGLKRKRLGLKQCGQKWQERWREQGVEYETSTLTRHKEHRLASKVRTSRPDSQCPGEWIKSRDEYVDMSATMSKDPSVSDPQKWQGLPLVRI